MYVPIGSYILLENGAINILDTERITPQLRDFILKDPITKVKTLRDIKEGHKIAAYFATLTSSFNLPASQPNPVIKKMSYFNPRVNPDDTLTIIWTKEESGRYRCQLPIRGDFLQDPVFDSKQNFFSDFPFSNFDIVRMDTIFFFI